MIHVLGSKSKLPAITLFQNQIHVIAGPANQVATVYNVSAIDTVLAQALPTTLFFVNTVRFLAE